MNKRLDWVSTFAVEICLSHGAENFRRGIFYCCINFGRRKSLDKRGEGDFRIFRRKFFVSQCRNFRGANPIVFHFFSAIENVCIRGGGRVSRFSVGNFLCHSAEKLRRGNCFCCINFGCRKSLDKGGGVVRIFRRKVFVSQCRKLWQRNPFVFHKICLPENFMN